MFREINEEEGSSNTDGDERIKELKREREIKRSHFEQSKNMKMAFDSALVGQKEKQILNADLEK